MPATVRRLSTYRFRQTDRLFFDANVWLYVYSPQYAPSDRRVRTYSDAFKRALAAQVTIFIDGLVLSEFINAWARFEYNKLSPQTKPKDFKTYRNSAAFAYVAKAVADACRRILRHATRIESCFTSLDIGAVLSDYAAGKMDFNDQIIAELCRERGFTLVTHDGDLKGSTLNILTENTHLLK